MAQTQDLEARYELRDWLAHTRLRAGHPEAAVAGWVELHAEAAPRSLPLPEPTAPALDLPPFVEPAADAPAVAFLVGAPGSGVERVADILAGALPAFRGDRKSTPLNSSH